MSFASGLEDNIFAEVGDHSATDSDEVVQTPPPSPDALARPEEGKPG